MAKIDLTTDVLDSMKLCSYIGLGLALDLQNELEEALNKEKK